MARSDANVLAATGEPAWVRGILIAVALVLIAGIVVLPQLLPALLTGFALAFARGVGEYGSVIFIAGNLPYVSEIAPLLIVIKLEEFDYHGATAIAVLMLALSFAILFFLNKLQRRLARGQSL